MIVTFSTDLIERDEHFLMLSLREDVEEWLKAHCGIGFSEQGRLYPDHDWGWWFEISNDDTTMIPLIQFKNPDHAVLFKLTWGGV